MDQETAERNKEPYVRLVKTRRINGIVLFSQHTVHLPLGNWLKIPRIRVGVFVVFGRTEMWKR